MPTWTKTPTGCSCICRMSKWPWRLWTTDCWVRLSNFSPCSSHTAALRARSTRRRSRCRRSSPRKRGSSARHIRCSPRCKEPTRSSSRRSASIKLRSLNCSNQLSKWHLRYLHPQGVEWSQLQAKVQLISTTIKFWKLKSCSLPKKNKNWSSWWPESVPRVFRAQNSGRIGSMRWRPSSKNLTLSKLGFNRRISRPFSKQC